jgi:hypothetical protein
MLTTQTFITTKNCLNKPCHKQNKLIVNSASDVTPGLRL